MAGTLGSVRSFQEAVESHHERSREGLRWTKPGEEVLDLRSQSHSDLLADAQHACVLRFFWPF